MKLYDADWAPSPRRVRIFLAEKGVDVETQKVDLRSGEQLGESFLKLNPCATVPCLELDDGTVINQVPSICLYFEEAHPEPPLLGTGAEGKAVVDMWNRRVEQEGLQAVAEAFRNGHPAFGNRALPGPHNYAQIGELAERGQLRYTHFLQMLDARLGETEHVAGDAFTIADISAMVAVDFAAAVKVGSIEGYGNIERWYQAVSGRPSAGA
jgi:glutathione S-transferase